MVVMGIPLLRLLFNPFIFIIEVAFLVAIWVIIDRGRALNRVKFDTRRFMQDIRNSLKKGGIKKAIELCESENHPLAYVVGEGLRNAGLSRDDVYDALEEAELRARSPLEKRVGMLTIIAFIAPLLGLFGTVVGIIQAFSAMAAAGGADPTVMLNGIAVALLTTAVGIIVAVPSAIAFGMFSGRVDAICSEIDIGAKDLVVALSEHVWKTEKRSKREPKKPVEELAEA